MLRSIIHACGFLAAGLLSLGFALAQDASEIQANFRKGQEHLQAEEYSEAAAMFKKVVEEKDDLPAGWLMLGYSLHLDGKLEQAIPAHERASKFDATKPIGLYNLACAYSLQEKKKKALDYLEESLAAGFQQIDMLDTDTDLDNIRKEARFVALVNKANGKEDAEIKLADAKDLVGDWTYAAGKRAGEKVPAERLAGEVTITKETITLPAGPDAKFVMAYQLDAKKSPATIDMSIKSGPVPEGKAQGVIGMKGKDTIVLCYNPMGERPTKFESTEENGFFLFELKRKK